MADQKRLFLVDAFALIFRGYYAFIKNPRINSKGLDTSAIMGFMNSLLDVIKRERPDHLAVCFDKGGSVDRVEMFEAYKANRDETPEAIKLAVPYIQEILKAMHIPIMVKEGFEADDVIGTLAKQAEKEGYKTFMVTPDKDFAQLVSENIFMYKPRFGGGYDIWGVPEVQEKFGVVDPVQVIDFLGMMGDSADNIPGLPGVGEKTAKKFLAAYGSMENLLANTHELKGKMKEKIEANGELGLLSKQLATIMLDVPVTFDAKDFELDQPDKEKVTEIFNDLEFRNLLTNFLRTFNVENLTAAKTTENKTEEKPKESVKKTISNTEGQFDLFAAPGTGSVTEEAVASGFKTIENTNHFYQHIDSPFSRKLLIQKLMSQTSVCFDTETTGLKALEVELIGIAFSYEVGKGYYVSFPENQEETKTILEEFRPFFESDIEKIGHNLKYDIKVLSNYQMPVKGKLFDTMIAHYLINPDMRHNMDVLAETYLNYLPVSITELIGKKGKNQLSMRVVPIKDQTEYAVEDADITLQLKEHFTKELESGNVTKLFNEVVHKVYGKKWKLHPFKVLTYKESMDKYGCDRPDLRFGLEMQDITDIVKETEFQVFAKPIEDGGIVKCIKVGAEFQKTRLSKGQIEKLTATAQNHGFAVDQNSLPDGVTETHKSLFDGTNCGIRLSGKPVFSVQHHPEANPGPRDSFYIFERFAAAL